MSQISAKAEISKVKSGVLIDIMKDTLHITQNMTIVFYFYFNFFCSSLHNSVFNF